MTLTVVEMHPVNQIFGHPAKDSPVNLEVADLLVHISIAHQKTPVVVAAAVDMTAKLSRLRAAAAESFPMSLQVAALHVHLVQGAHEHGKYLPLFHRCQEVQEEE